MFVKFDCQVFKRSYRCASKWFVFIKCIMIYFYSVEQHVDKLMKPIGWTCSINNCISINKCCGFTSEFTWLDLLLLQLAAGGCFVLTLRSRREHILHLHQLQGLCKSDTCLSISIHVPQYTCPDTRVKTIISFLPSLDTCQVDPTFCQVRTRVKRRLTQPVGCNRQRFTVTRLQGCKKSGVMSSTCCTYSQSETQVSSCS